MTPISSVTCCAIDGRGPLGVLLLLLPPPPGNSGASKLSHPGTSGRPGHRAFFLGTRIEEAQERQLPASGRRRRWCTSTPQNHRPDQLAAHIALGLGYHLGRAGG
jgi:hypothetical protein